MNPQTADAAEGAHMLTVAYASPGALPTALPPNAVARFVRRAFRVSPALAVVAAVAWGMLLYVTARSGLDARLLLGFELEIENGRFRFGRYGSPSLSGDVLLPLAALLAVPPAVASVRAVRRLRRVGGIRWRGVLHAARRPLFALAVVLAAGVEGWWVRLPPPPPVTWLPPDDALFAAEGHRFQVADPLADVEAALARGDRRLLGIGGAGGVVPPGLPDYWQRRAWYEEAFGVNWVPYTSDCISSREQGRYHGSAYDYAARYNPLLVARVVAAASRPASRPTNGSAP